MSSTLGSLYNNVTFALRSHTRAMAMLQEQAASGSRINRASDAPHDAYQVLGLSCQKRDLKQYISSLDGMISTLEFSSSVIEQIIPQVGDIKTQLTQITSDTYTESGRQRTAESVNDTLEHVLSLANTKHNDRYLYSGDASRTAPFEAVRDGNGKILRVEYVGSTGTNYSNVGDGVRASAHFVGEDIFQSSGSGQADFIGGTGAAAGSGTSSTKGYTWLDVTDENGDGTFELSIDGGKSRVNVDGTDNQAVVHSETNEVLYVDTTGITQTGTELVSASGTHGLFDTLIAVRDILSNERGLGETQNKQLRADAMDALDEVNGLLAQQAVTVGAKIGFLDDMRENLDNLKFNIDSEKQSIESADVAEIATELSRREVLYQMSLNISGRVMNVSLLDFIQ